MKKPKLIFKVNNNYSAKVYVGGKWQKDVCEIDVHGEPMDYTVKLTINKRNANGVFYTENDKNGVPYIAQEIKIFHIKKGRNPI